MDFPRGLRRVFWLVPVVLMSVIPRVGRAQTYVDLPGTQPGGLAGGEPLDGARPCGLTCHFFGDSTMTATTALPYDTYLGSMMGNTMRDPLFLAALTVADQDQPGIGDYCLRCHTPPGFVNGHTRGTPSASRGTALTYTDNDGVSCDSCHRMLATTDLGDGQYQFSPTATRFGPYATIDSIRHPGAQTTWLADARMCGTCHQLTNPTQHLHAADGSDTGLPFPLDTTYSEWANSDFAVAGSPMAKTCQDCHLPRVPGQAYVATNTTAMLRDMPRRHEFAGANAWAIRMLGAMRADVASGDFYDPTTVPYYTAAAARAETSLQSAVTLAIQTAPTTAMPGTPVTVIVRITNRSGHRVPTGYVDGRRMWLAVDLIDADMHTTPVSGTYDDTAAHLDETDTQLRLYEAVQGVTGMGAGGHIALNDTIVRDTRLPPSGFHPLPGQEPVGVDYSGGAGGSLRNWDDATYTIAIPVGARGPVTVRVRARYQTTTREYVQFLATANTTDTRGSDLLARYTASGSAPPFDMAVATAQIAVAAPPVDAGTDSAVDAGTDSGTDAGVPDAMDAAADAGTRGAAGCGCTTVSTRTTEGGRFGVALLVVSIVIGGARRRSRRRVPARGRLPMNRGL